VFGESTQLEAICKPKAGISTGKNEECIFYWWEPRFVSIGINQTERSEQYRFYPHNKGGGFRRWFGNCIYVLKYSDADIARMEAYAGFRHDNRNLYFRQAVSWGKITSSLFSARLYPPGFTFDSAGLSLFFDQPLPFLALMNSTVFSHLLGSISNTLNFTVGDIGRSPIMSGCDLVESCAEEAVELSRNDWDACELSWNYSRTPLLHHIKSETLEGSLELFTKVCADRRSRLQTLEETNNRLFIQLYGLDKELAPDIPDDHITLYKADREEDTQRLISYAIGCMMGRNSLDNPGLIYAQGGGDGFDHDLYQTFPADQDGIIPITAFEWFEDDAANRLETFVATVWPKEHLEENLTFVAESIGLKKNESVREAIRRYLSNGFYKHHLRLYKKRPIYWLFSSGKQRAFQCLVYLHRYNAGTLARMRTEYVIPLSGKIDFRIEQLESDITAASSTAHEKKLTKERDTLIKHSEEIQKFDEKLKHYADQRIELDLDDGVKVNYGKFGDLLAEVKAITGKKAEE
jgi:hypothetical protein